VTSTLPSP
jgi:outer membrane receptor protein involved in Fe transport